MISGASFQSWSESVGHKSVVLVLHQQETAQNGVLLIVTVDVICR